MQDFIKKFFGYYQYPDSDGNLGNLVLYNDGNGGGISDWRHFVWILLVAVGCIVLYRVFQKRPNAGKRFTQISLSYIFIVRLINQVIRAIIGAEIPAWRAFPFHMCTVLCFLLPIVYLLRIRKLLEPVCVLSIMGGIIAIIIAPDYFDSSFIPFGRWESMIVHTVLAIVPIVLIASKELTLHFRKIWQTMALLLVLMIWAFIANEIFFPAYEPNYMYLQKNALPGNLGGDYYLLAYAAIYVLFTGIIYGAKYIYLWLHRVFLEES